MTWDVVRMPSKPASDVPCPRPSDSGHTIDEQGWVKNIHRRLFWVPAGLRPTRESTLVGTGNRLALGNPVVPIVDISQCLAYVV